MSFVVEPSESFIVERAGAEFSAKPPTAVKVVPGRRICWEVAPAARIAETTAWTVTAQTFMSSSWGSFMMPNIILEEEAYLVASLGWFC